MINLSISESMIYDAIMNNMHDNKNFEKDGCECIYRDKNDKIRLCIYDKTRCKLVSNEDLEEKPKVGQWLILDDCEQFIAKCSECGRIIDSRDIHRYPYCTCGAKMSRQT